MFESAPHFSQFRGAKLRVYSIESCRRGAAQLSSREICPQRLQEALRARIRNLRSNRDSMRHAGIIQTCDVSGKEIRSMLVFPLAPTAFRQGIGGNP